MGSIIIIMFVLHNYSSITKTLKVDLSNGYQLSVAAVCYISGGNTLAFIYLYHLLYSLRIS